MPKRHDLCQAPETWFPILPEGLIEVPPKRLKRLAKETRVLPAKQCITLSRELRFLSLIRLLPEGLSVFMGGIISNNSGLRGATHVKP